jgi:flagellar hook-associated protein 3 FlgL
MRVTYQAVHRHNNAALETAASRLMEAQRQVATGKRVERGSHDPSAAAAATVERNRLAGVDAYTAAGDSAKARLTVVDTVLDDLVRQLTSAQVALVGARGSTTTPEQREARARELESLRDAVMQGFNTSFRGTYLFGGAAAVAPPFVKDAGGVVSAYQGSTAEVAVDIDSNLEVAVVLNGDAIARGTEADDLFVVFDRAITAVRNGDGAGMDTAAADVQRAFERVTLAQGRIGASLRFVDDSALRLGATARATTARIATLEDANMAAAITNMTQAETVYRAALGATAQLQGLSLMDYLR